MGTTEAELVLKKFLDTEFVKVSCLDGEKCDEGFCKASLSVEDGKYTLVTGIIPGADYLGDCSFTKGSIVIGGGNSVKVKAAFGKKIKTINITPYVETK